MPSPSTRKPDRKSLNAKMFNIGSNYHLSTENKLVESSLQIIERTQKSLFNDNKYRVLAMEEASKTMRKYLKEKEKLNFFVVNPSPYYAM